MKTFILTLILLFSCSLAYAAYTNIGGYYRPTTKTYSETAQQASGTLVWQPASGKRIVLMGLIASFAGGVDAETTAAIGTGIDSTGSGLFVDVVPMYGLASGPVIIASGVPIWEGLVDQSLFANSSKIVDGGLVLWGYEN